MRTPLQDKVRSAKKLSLEKIFCIILIFMRAFTTSISVRHVVPLSALSLTLTLGSTMKPKSNLRKWKTTTAICLASTVAIATAAYAHSAGVSSWDLLSHPNRLMNQVDSILSSQFGIPVPSRGTSGGKGNGNGNGNGGSTNPADNLKTASPIKHVIILIGENRGLDHTFGVYKPKGSGQTISNLLSKGIVNEDGSPGPNFAQAQQFAVAGQPSYYIGAPAIAKSPYGATNVMPQPDTNGAPTAQSDTGAPFKTIAEASAEKDIDPASLDILTTGFTGLP